MKRTSSILAAAASFAAAVLLLNATAWADAVSCDILCIWATNSETGMDDALKDIPELKKPPFAGYKGYRLINRPAMKLAAGAAGETMLTDKYKLSISYTGMKSEDGKERLSLHVRVDPKKRIDMRLSSRSGKRFFLAGLTHKDGLLIVGITCTKAD